MNFNGYLLSGDNVVAEIKFKENIFADIALTGSIDSYNKTFTKKQLSSRTPEINKIGSYEKFWEFENGSWYMYK